MAHEKVDEENVWVYISKILKWNCAKFNSCVDVIDKMQIEYSNIKDNFLKIVENIKNLEKQNRPATDEKYPHFPKIDELKLLLKISSNIHYETALSG